MQLDRFIRGTLPLWAMVCFSCGGSYIQRGRSGADRRRRRAVRSRRRRHRRRRRRHRSAAAAARPGAAGIRSPAPTSSTRGASRPIPSTSAPTRWPPSNVEFHNLTALESGADFAVYHPITFHLNSETVTNAAIKLHGQSSWAQTVMLDGDRAKMQFDVSFDQFDPKGSFHGVSKLVFDMPRDDWTFMHDRVSQAWLRQTGIMAPCSASARLDINGSYYGLYVLEQGVGNGTVNAFFPANPHGDLWKGGVQAETNTASPNVARLKQFKSAKDLASLSAIVDVPSSLTSWGAEALLNDSDGYYGGDHNFYLYDQGPAGFVFLPQDTDSTSTGWPPSTSPAPPITRSTGGRAAHSRRRRRVTSG